MSTAIPRTRATGRQTVTAFGVLADVGSGYPMLITEMTILTALRTAATSAMAAKYLAPKGATHDGHHRQWRAVRIPGRWPSRRVLGIDKLRLYDIDPIATKKCARNLAGLGFDITVCCDAGQKRSSGADIITTVTADKKYATILTDNMVGSGVHINAVGGDCPGKTELHRDILLRSDIFVEFPPQTRIEGEIQQLDAAIRSPSSGR